MIAVSALLAIALGNRIALVRDFKAGDFSDALSAPKTPTTS